MAVKLIFSFDSEDYITPEAAEAEKWWAEAMTRHGVTACICLVGELARSLRDRGRRDVIAAMGRHEICYHSDMHSASPSHAEQLDRLSWTEGVAAIRAREARGLDDVAELFGRAPSAYCKPGASWGPPVSVAMAECGVPVFCDAPFEWEPGRLMWFDGQLCLAYHCHFDGYFEAPDEERLPRMKADFERRLAAHDGGVLVMYTHPCRLVTTQFWDGVNFSHGTNPPREQWRPAPLRTPEKIVALKRDFDAFIGWAVSQPDVELTTYSALHAAHRLPPAPWITRAELLRLAREVGDPPASVRTDGEWLSPAEVFGLVARTLAAYAETGSLPEVVAVRRLLGPTEPVPGLPEGRIEVPLSALLSAARDADAHATATGAVPARLKLGVEVGPNVFLQAARAALEKLAHAAAGRLPAQPARPSASEPPVFRLPSAVWNEETALAQRPAFRDMRFRGGWVIFPAEFEGRNVIEMARLQTWTGKPVGAG
jgi:hypothetical protein